MLFDVEGRNGFEGRYVGEESAKPGSGGCACPCPKRDLLLPCKRCCPAPLFGRSGKPAVCGSGTPAESIVSARAGRLSNRPFRSMFSMVERLFTAR